MSGPSQAQQAVPRRFAPGTANVLDLGTLRWFCVGLSIAVWSGAIAAADPADSVASTRDPVPTWIEELDSPQAAIRAAAIERLLAAGPRILPRLPALDNATSPQLKDAITQLRRKLEQQLVLSASEPSYITLAGQMTWQAACVHLQQTTEDPLNFSAVSAAERSRLIDVHWEKTPFWEAVAELEQRSRTVLQFQSESQQFEFQSVAAPSLLSPAICGPVRVQLASLQQRALPGDSNQRLLRTECRVQVEPRLRPILLEVRAAHWHAIAGDRMLPAWNPAAAYELDFADGSPEVALPLDFLGAVPTEELQELRGSGTLHLAVGQEHIEFAGRQLQRGTLMQRGNVSVRMQQIRFEEATPPLREATVRIVVNYTAGGPAFESHRLGLFARAAWLVTSDGQRIDPQHHEIVAEVDGGIGLQYQFTGLTGKALDYAFLYETPALLLATPLEFSLLKRVPVAKAAE